MRRRCSVIGLHDNEYIATCLFIRPKLGIRQETVQRFKRLLAQAFLTQHAVLRQQRKVRLFRQLGTEL